MGQTWSVIKAPHALTVGKQIVGQGNIGNIYIYIHIYGLECVFNALECVFNALRGFFVTKNNTFKPQNMDFRCFYAFNMKNQPPEHANEKRL